MWSEVLPLSTTLLKIYRYWQKEKASFIFDVIYSPWSSSESVSWLTELWTQLGQQPVNEVKEKGLHIARGVTKVDAPMLGPVSLLLICKSRRWLWLRSQSWQSSSFCIKSTEHVTSSVLWRATPSFLRFSAAQAPFKLMTPTQQLIWANSRGSTWAERAGREEKYFCSKMKRWVPLFQLRVSSFTHHQPPYVRSLMLRGKMARAFIRLSSPPSQAPSLLLFMPLNPRDQSAY